MAKDAIGGRLEGHIGLLFRILSFLSPEGDRRPRDLRGLKFCQQIVQKTPSSKTRRLAFPECASRPVTSPEAPATGLWSQSSDFKLVLSSSCYCPVFLRLSLRSPHEEDAHHLSSLLLE